MVGPKSIHAGYRVDAIVAGKPVNFTRRRYGATTFTWVSYHNGSQWVELGDPWPSLNVSREEIEKAIQQKENG